MFKGFTRRLPDQFAGDGSVWPADRVLDQMRARYGTLEHLGDERNASMYGVEESGVRFVAVLLKVIGRPDAVAEIGFVARFTGYGFTQSAAELLNRNLHISIVAIDGGDDVYLVGGFLPSGAFSEATFGLMLDAWRRDLGVALQAIAGGPSALASLPGASAPQVRAFAENRAGGHSSGGGTVDPVATFFGARAGSVSVCRACDGRGRTGLFARTCDVCGGTGLVFASPRGD